MPDVINCLWRVGRKRQRNIYAIIPGEDNRDRDVFVCLAEDWNIAERIVNDHNGWLELQQVSQGPSPTQAKVIDSITGRKEST